jgi:hypothetical protein
MEALFFAVIIDKDFLLRGGSIGGLFLLAKGYYAANSGGCVSGAREEPKAAAVAPRESIYSIGIHCRRFLEAEISLPADPVLINDVIFPFAAKTRYFLLR